MQPVVAAQSTADATNVSPRRAKRSERMQPSRVMCEAAGRAHPTPVAARTRFQLSCHASAAHMNLPSVRDDTSADRQRVMTAQAMLHTETSTPQFSESVDDQLVRRVLARVRV